MLGARIAALAARRDRSRLHLVAEFDDRQEAVAARAVDFLRSVVGLCAEARERSPAARRERDGDARAGIAEGLHDVAREALETIDFAPRNLPGAEVGGELVRDRDERLQPLAGARTLLDEFVQE